MINCNTAKDMSEGRTELSRLLKHSMFIHDCFFFFFLLSAWNSKQGRILCSQCNMFHPSSRFPVVLFEKIKSLSSSLYFTLFQMDIFPKTDGL